MLVTAVKEWVLSLALRRTRRTPDGCVVALAGRMALPGEGPHHLPPPGGVMDEAKPGLHLHLAWRKVLGRWRYMPDFERQATSVVMSSDGTTPLRFYPADQRGELHIMFAMAEDGMRLR